MVKFNDLTDSEKTDKKARFNILSDEIDAAVAGDSTIATKVEALEEIVGDEETAGTILARLKALEDDAQGNTQQEPEGN